MAPQLISPPQKPVPPDLVHGPATPPVEGIDLNHIPKGVRLQWLLDVAWDWRNSCASPEVENNNVRVLRESELQEMEKVAPWVAAIARQQAEEARASMKRTKLTRTIAWIQEQIIDQYGWPERE